MRYAEQEPMQNIPYSPPTPRKKSKAPLIALIVGLAMLLVCGFLTVASLGGSTDPVATPLTAVDSPSSTPKPRQTSKGNPDQVQISEGGYVVGEDIPAGTYRTPGARKEAITLCSWEVREDGTPDGPLDLTRLGVIDGTDEQADVVLRKGDYFKTTGCERWTKRR